MSIGCYRHLFRVRVGNHPRAAIEQKGIPFVKGKEYSFRFSWEKAFGNSPEVKVRFWSARDSAPDMKIAQDSEGIDQLLTLRK